MMADGHGIPPGAAEPQEIDDGLVDPGPPTASQLAYLRDRIGSREVMLASQLRRYREQEGWTHDELAGHFGISAEALDRLGLSGRPRADRYAADVRAIAATNGVSDFQLIQVLRAADVAVAFGPGATGTRRFLVAARDHDAEAAATTDKDGEDPERADRTTTDREGDGAR